MNDNILEGSPAQHGNEISMQLLDTKTYGAANNHQQSMGNNNRASWMIGSKIEILSSSSCTGRWMIGEIINTFNHDGIDWLVIQYDNNKIKTIEKYDNSLRSIKHGAEGTELVQIEPTGRRVIH